MSELQALGSIVAALEPLDCEARERIISYCANRFSVSNIEDSVKVSGTSPQKEGGTLTGYDEFAEFLVEHSKGTDRDRALLAAVWLDAATDGATFQSAEANALLNDCGEKVKNITRALNTLKEESPAKVVKTQKSGSSRQARVTYKVTAAARREVKGRLTTDE